MSGQLRTSDQSRTTQIARGCGELAVPVYACDRDGVIQLYNDEAAELWGRKPMLGDNSVRFCGAVKRFNADGPLLPSAATPMAGVLHSGNPCHDAKLILERPDGSRVEVLMDIDRITNKDHQVVGAVAAIHQVVS